MLEEMRPCLHFTPCWLTDTTRFAVSKSSSAIPLAYLTSQLLIAWHQPKRLSLKLFVSVFQW